MIVCTNCGNHNEDDDEFCGSCGKFLEWVGQRIEAPAEPVSAEPEPEPEPTKVGIVDRVKHAVGIDENGRTAEPATVGAAAASAQAGGGQVAAPAPEAGADVDHAQLEADAHEAALEAARAEEEARRRGEEEARAKAAAEEARRAQQAAEERAVAEEEARRRADAEARRRGEVEAKAQAEAERRRQAEAEAAQRALEETAALAAAEAHAAGASEENAAEAAVALDAARRSEEEARLKAESEARARAEAEAKAREEEEARRRAEEEARQRAEQEARAKEEAVERARQEQEARQRAEDEQRAKAQAEQRAREQEEARRRAAALLSRPRPAPAPAPAADPAVPAASQTSPAAAQRPSAQQPVAQQPVAQQPAHVKAPPRPDPKVKTDDKVVKPGDLVCGQCGTGNDPARKFCRKCGNSLVQAVAAKKLPWWKRLFSKKEKKAKSGSMQSKRAAVNDVRFKTTMIAARARMILGILAMVGLGGALYVPSSRQMIAENAGKAREKVTDLFNPSFEPVNAVAVAATSSAPGHEPNFANDLGSNTFWAEGAEGEGVGQTLSFTFETKVDLTRVIVRSGASDSPDNFLKQPRPKELHLVFDNGGSADITLKDQLAPQSFNLKGAKQVGKVDVVISSIYKGQSGQDTSIAEVEFKKKG